LLDEKTAPAEPIGLVLTGPRSLFSGLEVFGSKRMEITII
jgi:hypothetical protein